MRIFSREEDQIALVPIGPEIVGNRFIAEKARSIPIDFKIDVGILPASSAFKQDHFC